jgi:hypothetical protein
MYVIVKKTVFVTGFYMGMGFRHLPVVVAARRVYVGVVSVCNMYHNNRHNYTQIYCIYTLTTPIIMVHTCCRSSSA